MMRRSAVAVALCVAGVLAGSAEAQFGGHYPVGVEGLKGPSLPPPGLYLRDYNLYYTADEYPDGPPNFDLDVFALAPRLIWITDKKLWGANYGMDVLVPLLYTGVEVGPYDESSTGIGDVQVEPLLLAWHGAQWDAGAGYALWLPVGQYDVGEPDLPGKGFWSHMLTLGGTWYPDAAKKWSAAALNRYEIHQEVKGTDITPGDTWTLEAGVGYSPKPMWDVGVIGYIQQQVTEDDACDGALASDEKDRVYAVGPEVAGVCPVTGLMFSLRYAHEFSAHDRPEGDVGVLTVTHRF